MSGTACFLLGHSSELSPRLHGDPSGMLLWPESTGSSPAWGGRAGGLGPLKHSGAQRALGPAGSSCGGGDWAPCQASASRKGHKTKAREGFSPLGGAATQSSQFNPVPGSVFPEAGSRGRRGPPPQHPLKCTSGSQGTCSSSGLGASEVPSSHRHAQELAWSRSQLQKRSNRGSARGRCCRGHAHRRGRGARPGVAGGLSPPSEPAVPHALLCQLSPGTRPRRRRVGGEGACRPPLCSRRHPQRQLPPGQEHPAHEPELGPPKGKGSPSTGLGDF